MCDRCGDEIRYRDLKSEWTGLRVCKSCWDPKTPLEFPKNFPIDAEALRDPRPDNDIEASHGIVKVGTGAANAIGSGFKLKGLTVELGTVTVTLV